MKTTASAADERYLSADERYCRAAWPVLGIAADERRAEGDERYSAADERYCAHPLRVV